MKENQLLSSGEEGGGGVTFLSYLFIFFLLGLFGKMYFVFQPLSPQEVPQGKKMHIRDGMFYHYLVPFYTCVS